MRSSRDHEARWSQVLALTLRTPGRLVQSSPVLENEPAGEAPCGFDMQPLAALPERACQMREMAGDLFFADSDACRKFTSRERPLSEHPPEFRPYRHVPLGQLRGGWLFRQWAHLRSKAYRPARAAASSARAGAVFACRIASAWSGFPLAPSWLARASPTSFRASSRSARASGGSFPRSAFLISSSARWIWRGQLLGSAGRPPPVARTGK